MLAQLIGYKKISLIRKPYHIIFKLLSTKLFEVIDELNDDEKIKFNVIHIRGSGNKEVNLIVEDTYNIQKHQIPDKFIHFETIRFFRENIDGTRIYSSTFMDEIGRYIIEYRNKKYKINLFMTTNVKNTRYLIENYFLNGDRGFTIIEIFQMDMNDEQQKIYRKRIYI